LNLLESKNDSIVDSAAGALWNLAQDTENKRRIGEPGIQALLQRLQGQHTPVRQIFLGLSMCQLSIIPA
jgi:hypothetical protein